MNRATFDELERAAEDAQAALDAHWGTLKLFAWYGAASDHEREAAWGTRELDDQWLTEYHALKAARDKAEDHRLRYLTRRKL